MFGLFCNGIQADSFATKGEAEKIASTMEISKKVRGPKGFGEIPLVWTVSQLGDDAPPTIPDLKSPSGIAAAMRSILPKKSKA